MFCLLSIAILVLSGANRFPQHIGNVVDIQAETAATNPRPVNVGGAELADVRNDLAKVSSLWAQLWMGKELDRVLELYAADAEFLTGSGDRFTGKPVIRDLFKMAFEINTSNISVRSIRTEVAGDMAFDSGEYRETLTPLSGAAKLELQGNYLIVFEKRGGKWLIVEHVWTDKPANKS
jgi:uncharacterized protein (TIGR02246 family)